ncbi:PHO86 [[Candida] subhashii]|uniref:PHO86 n=1 Tax=[Candida] subhashii TaxID=561895 RepID=A0A8J5QNN4_9ASCO|nr:PHO86 [[Candida] subhashii]KAG7661450.1 PHO86 [[Candida] subhashii]
MKQEYTADQKELCKSPLTPDLSKAARRLHANKYKQLQATLNRFVIWHPIAIIIYTTVIPSILVYKLWEFVEVSDSLLEFVFLLMKNPRDFIFNVVSGFPMIAGIFGIFGFFTFMMGDDMGSIQNKMILGDYNDSLFGFDYRKFMNLDIHTKDKEDKEFLKNGLNTQIIEYYDVPIAICTLVADEKQSTPENFIVKITGLTVLKKYEMVDFDSLLLEWAVLRSHELYDEYAKNKKKVENGTILILIEAYSFDKQLLKTLSKNNFGVMDKTYELNPFTPVLSSGKEKLHQFLSISRDTFGLLLTTNKEDKKVMDNIKDQFLNKEEELIVEHENLPEGIRKRT